MQLFSNMDEEQTGEQTNQNEETSGRVLTSSTCHDLTCYNEPVENEQEDESNKENKLFKNKSESDLLVNKNKLKKIYLPAEDTMDLERSYKEETGKNYSSSWFYRDSSKNIYPTIEEQVKLCRKIASQLVDDENRKSKGASMFFKRVKRAAKWVHEGQGTKDTSQNTSSSNSTTAADEEVEKLKRNLKLELMPNLKLILDPRELLSLEKLKKTSDIVEHNMVSPDVCHNLVKDLNSPEINKGAAIFLKRKEKSRDWIVDETSTVVQIREQKREQELKKQNEDNVQKEWLMKKQKEILETVDAMTADLKSSSDFDSGQQKTLYIQAKQPLKQINLGNSLSNLSKNHNNCSNVSQTNQSKHNIQSNQFLKLNFKNFNRNARGWGIPTDEYEKQIQKLQETPEYKLNISYPINQSISQSMNQSNGQTINQSNGQKISQSNVQSNYGQTNHSQSNYGQPNHGQSSYNQSINPLNNPSSHYSTTNYQTNSVSQLLPKQQTQFQQNKTITNHNYPKTSHSNLVNRRSLPLDQSVHLKQPLNTGHTVNSANFNTYIFDKQANEQYNIATLARNDPHSTYSQMPIYKQTNLYSNGTSFNDQANVAAQQSNGQLNHSNFIQNHQASLDNSIKHFDLTKFQIPNRLPKFKDFNAKPKIFIRTCT